MSDAERDPHRLSIELAQLKAALRAVQAPPADDGELRAAFRDSLRRRQRARAARLVGSRRVRWAAAAALVLGLAATLGAALLGGNGELAAPTLVSAPAAVAVPAAAPLVVAPFQPLLNAPAFSPDASYTVVRVRIPLASFALVPGSEQDGTVEADLLVGEDGLARGIRFTPADASLLASAQR